MIDLNSNGFIFNIKMKWISLKDNLQKQNVVMYLFSSFKKTICVILKTISTKKIQLLF